MNELEQCQFTKSFLFIHLSPMPFHSVIPCLPALCTPLAFSRTCLRRAGPGSGSLIEAATSQFPLMTPAGPDEPKCSGSELGEAVPGACTGPPGVLLLPSCGTGLPRRSRPRRRASGTSRSRLTLQRSLLRGKPLAACWLVTPVKAEGRTILGQLVPDAAGD